MDRKGNSQAKSKSAANAVAFVTRNRFAVLDSLGEVCSAAYPCTDSCFDYPCSYNDDLTSVHMG